MKAVEFIDLKGVLGHGLCEYPDIGNVEVGQREELESAADALTVPQAN
jgi:hypothetical protein